MACLSCPDSIEIRRPLLSIKNFLTLSPPPPYFGCHERAVLNSAALCQGCSGGDLLATCGRFAWLGIWAHTSSTRSTRAIWPIKCWKSKSRVRENGTPWRYGRIIHGLFFLLFFCNGKWSGKCTWENEIRKGCWTRWYTSGSNCLGRFEIKLLKNWYNEIVAEKYQMNVVKVSRSPSTKTKVTSTKESLCHTNKAPRKAYVTQMKVGKVPREEVWNCMDIKDVPKSYVQLVEDMYHGSTSYVKCSIGYSDALLNLLNYWKQHTFNHKNNLYANVSKIDYKIYFKQNCTQLMGVIKNLVTNKSSALKMLIFREKKCKNCLVTECFAPYQWPVLSAPSIF